MIFARKMIHGVLLGDFGRTPHVERRLIGLPPTRNRSECAHQWTWFRTGHYVLDATVLVLPTEVWCIPPINSR